MNVEIYIGSKKIELFDDERISISLSVTDIEDLEKIKGDFSKDFTVPAGKENNAVFKHFYDIDIDNSFDARTKVNGRIDINGIPWRYGKFRLEKVSLKSGSPTSYTISFFSNLLDIKQLIRNDELNVLDLSAYDHAFTSANVKTGLQSGLFSRDIVYTLNPKKQYYYNSDPTDTTNEETFTNIAWNTSKNVHGINYKDLSPSIKALRVVEAIETKYGLTFSPDFFEGAVFSNLYYGLVNDIDSIANTTLLVDFDGGDNDWIDFATDTGTYPVNGSYSGGENYYFVLYFTVNQSSGFEGTEFDIIIEVNGVEEVVSTGNYGRTVPLRLNSDSTETFSVVFKVRSSEPMSFTTSLQQVRWSTGSPSLEVFTTTSSEQTIAPTVTVSNNLPKIKIIDWLTGLFQAFKLVVVPQDDGSLLVQSLNQYYASGKLLDITEYVDFEETFYERGDIFSEINFNFEEPSAILGIQFEKNNQIGYGNEELKLEDESGNPIDGESYDIEVPFETVVYDRLQDQTLQLPTNIMYAPLIDEDRNPIVPKSYFHYTSTIPIGEWTMKYVTEGDALEELSGNINTQTHSESITGSGVAFLFGVEFHEFSGLKMNRTLVSEYHLDYILGAFNVKRRILKCKAYLPYNLISNIALNDVYKIRDTYWRPDNIELDITTGEATLTLLNTFENDLSGLTVGNKSFNVDYLGQEVFVQTSVESPTVNLLDVGYGTAWLSTSIVKGNINVTVSENLTGAPRAAYVAVLDPVAIKPQQTVYINQSGTILSITADNTSITADNAIITADNG